MSVSSVTPGRSTSYGTTTPQNVSEFLQSGGILGPMGLPQVGNDGYVSFGPGYVRKADVGRAGSPGGARETYPIDTAQQFWYQMDDYMFNEWSNEVQRGLSWDVTRDSDRLQNDWNRYTQAAGAYNKATGQSVSPIEFLRMQNDRLERLGKLPKQGGGAGSGSSSVVNLTNPTDAQVLVDNALATYLGRAATEEERGQFLSVLNQKERANPINTTPSSRSGGVNNTQIAKDFARSQEGAAEFMADTQYMDWFMDKITGDPTKEIASGLGS